MVYAGLDEAPYIAQARRDVVQFLISIAALSLLVSFACLVVRQAGGAPFGSPDRGGYGVGRGFA